MSDSKSEVSLVFFLSFSLPAAGKTYRDTAVGARGRTAKCHMQHAAPAPECGVTLAANGMDAARTLFYKEYCFPSKMCR